MSKSYFRNFRSSPAEQRESESELDKGEKERHNIQPTCWISANILDGGDGGAANLQIWEEETWNLPGV